MFFILSTVEKNRLSREMLTSIISLRTTTKKKELQNPSQARREKNRRSQEMLRSIITLRTTTKKKAKQRNFICSQEKKWSKKITWTEGLEETGIFCACVFRHDVVQVTSSCLVKLCQHNLLEKPLRGFPGDHTNNACLYYRWLLSGLLFWRATLLGPVR